MQSERFEWDDAKANGNWQKHGISFDYAVAIFDDPSALDVFDDREDYGEERYNIVGRTADGVYLHVTYTERDVRIRIISARRALKNEIARCFPEIR